MYRDSLTQIWLYYLILPILLITDTPKLQNIETYSETVDMKKYDAFLILATSRFHGNEWSLAKKVISLKKPFMFIRTHIDENYRSEKRKKKFDEKVMLRKIRNDCVNHLKEFGIGDKDVFLISNHYPTKWDFSRLTKAILDAFPLQKKECLTLSLNTLTSASENVIIQKVKFLRGNNSVFFIENLYRIESQDTSQKQEEF